MNYLAVIVCAALTFNATPWAQASTIQLDFRGIVTLATDSNGNVFSSAITPGSEVTGRIVWDESSLAGFVTDSRSDGVGTSAFTTGLNRPFPWINSEIYVGGQTFKVRDYLSDPPQVPVEAVFWNATASGSITTYDSYAGLDLAQIAQNSVINYSVSDSLTSRNYGSSSGLAIYGLTEDISATSSNDILDINTLGLLKSFIWDDYESSSGGIPSGVYYTRRAHLSGDITSVTVTRLDQQEIPEPSSLALLFIGIGAAMLGTKRAGGTAPKRGLLAAAYSGRSLRASSPSTSG